MTSPGCSMAVTSPCSIVIRSASTADATAARARATESGSNSMPVSDRAREPAGHRDQPAAAAAVDVEDARPGREVRHELREPRAAPPGRTPRCPGRSGARWRPGSGPGRGAVGRPVRNGLRQVPEVEASRRRELELAAEVLRAVRVEQDRGDVGGERHAVVGQLHEVVRGGAPRPAPRRRRATSACGARARRSSGPMAPASAQLGEQPELQADRHVPRPIEAAEARDEVLEAVVELHGAHCGMRDGA